MVKGVAACAIGIKACLVLYVQPDDWDQLWN